MNKRVSLSLITLLIFVLSFVVADQAFASNGAFLSEMCNMLNIVTGSAGKVIASVAVVAVGVGFFTGKVSWGLLVGVSTGVGLMFGAPTMVSAISGKSYYECIQDKTYVTTCVGNECYSCPVGYGSENCSSCGVGFTGPSCSDCAPGYEGEQCSQCEVGYSKYEGVCYLDCQVSSVPGIVDTIVSGGVGTKACDAANFSGSVEYSCLNSSFTVTQNNCYCIGNYSGTNCTECVTGYLGTTCSECDANYTKIGSVCYKNCTANVTGVAASSSLLPPAGTIQCNDAGYSGAVDYNCVDGLFTATGGSCTYNHCLGGTTSVIFDDGVQYKLHVFTSGVGTFTCPVQKNVEYLVVGGGGGGGVRHAGGGGAGGLLSGSAAINAGTAYSVTVGAGGGSQNRGSNSAFGSIVANGGGNGSTNGGVITQDGGSGGGGSNGRAGGAATSGQGNSGGNANYGGIGAGGGGAGGNGSDTANFMPGSGGAGVESSITGVPKYYAGGGGGGSWFQSSNSALSTTYRVSSYGLGGSGVGGRGGDSDTLTGASAASNTGSGGGGGGAGYGNNSPHGNGGSGGSGIVVIRYIY